MPSLPELSGDINKDLSPLSGDITKDLGAAPSPLKPPGFMARLQGSITGQDPTALSQKAEQTAQRLEQGPQTLPGIARMAGLPSVAKFLPGDYALQQQAALPAAGNVLGRMGLQAGLGGAEAGLQKKGLVDILKQAGLSGLLQGCLLYTSDAADE